MSEYLGNELEYAQARLDEADKMYERHKGDIQTAKDHFILKSDHLEARAALPGRSAHYFPEIHSAIRSRAATIYGVMTSGVPPIKLEPTDPEIPGIRESVQRLEDYVNHCYLSGGLWQVLYSAFVNAEMFPYAPVYLDWNDKWGVVNGVDAIVYAGGRYHSLQPEDYRGDLYARNTADMRYNFILKDVSVGYIRQMQKMGYYNQEFDLGTLEQATKTDWSIKRQKERFNEEYQKPAEYSHEIVVGWVKVFDEEREVETWRVCTFTGSLLLDEKETPYTGLDAPFELLHSEDLPGEVAGISTSKLAEANQNAINEFWNLSIEADEYDIYSPQTYKGQVLSEAAWEYQALWQVSEDFEVQPLLKPNPSRNFLEKIKFLEEANQQLTASYDTIQPTTEGSKQTLGEYMSKKQQHSKILAINFEFYAASISRLTKMMLGMAQQRLPQWMELQLLGGGSILRKLLPQDLVADVVIDIPKVRALANEELAMVKWQGIMSNPAIMQNPLIVSNPALMYAHLERFYEALGEKNIVELIGEKPQTMGGLNAPSVQAA